MAVLFEEVERVPEDRGASLHAVVEPVRAVFFFVEGYRRRLSAADAVLLDHRDVELFRMLREGCCAGLDCGVSACAVRGLGALQTYHACGSGADDDDLLLAILKETFR